MMRVLVAMALVLVAACGGSPTQPGPVTLPPIPAPVVTTEPTPPAPVEEPQPVPPPLPAPLPRPEPTWTATTLFAHWYGPALLPSSFAVEWRYSTLWFGALTADIQMQDSRSILATGKDYTIQIVIAGDTATWTLNGVGGQASGTARLQ